MPKLHITSLLRPHATYKTTTQQHQQQRQQQPILTAISTADASQQTPSSETKHLFNSENSINTIELIPTLEFVSTTTAHATLNLSQQCLETCLANDKQLFVSSTSSSSTKTFTIDRTSNEWQQDQQEEESPSSLIDTSELLLQQEVVELNLTDTASFTTYFDEPTSSISIGIMENTSSEQRSTTDHMPASTKTSTTSRNITAATSNTTTSQRKVPQSLTNPSLSERAGDEEEEIEEEIEEALEMSEEQDVSVSLPGPSKKPAVDQLFGIDLTDSSSLDFKNKTKKIKSGSLKTSSDSDQFKIDDEQLSGGKLAKHFLTTDEESKDSKDVRLPLEKSLVHSKHESSDFEDEVNTPKSSREEAEDVSLANQSTTDDISELQEEEKLEGEFISEDITDNKSKTEHSVTHNTLAATKSKESQQSSSKPAESKSPIDEKQRITRPSRPELFENPDIKPLSGASSLHSEKDHSIEEIMASNQSMEMTFDDKDLSSLNPSFDIHNENLVNELLADTPDRTQISTRSQTSLQEQAATEKVKFSVKENNKFETKAIPREEDDFSQELPKLKESITVSIVPNEQVEEELFEKILPSEMVTDLDDSLQEQNDKPMTSKQEKKDLQNNLTLKEHQSKIEQLEPWTTLQINTAEEEDEDTDMQLMKLRVMAMQIQANDINLQLSPSGEAPGAVENSQAKAMERISLVNFSKDVLEDITEESERNSLSMQDEHNSLQHEKSATLTSRSESKTLHNKDNNGNTSSTVSLNMIQVLEQKVVELQEMLVNKDACLASLNSQLENSQRRDSQNNHNSSELIGSGRDSSSLTTNSTEYRTLQEDFGQPTMDIYMELSKRDELIAKLNDSLQQSLTIRESLQTETEKLTHEVVVLRKQLTEAMESCKKPFWPRDQESNCGQRISEISMDLISESDDDLDRIYLTDNEERISRSSRERQMSMPRQYEYATSDVEMPCAFSKQIEQFHKYLTPSEVRLFFMVQEKFDNYLCQELEKSKIKYEQELKIVMDQWDSEKQEKQQEIQKLLQQRQEREAKHNQEMENLRKYFETKCADLEKQFSDDVFSQKSQRLGISSSSASDCSDQEQLPEDFRVSIPRKSKESSPRKRSKAELLLSPSHRQMTPGHDTFNEDSSSNQGAQLALEITELKSFYQNKIHEIQRSQDETIKKLSDRLKYYESRYAEDEFVSSSTKNSTLNSKNETIATTHSEDITQLNVRSLNENPTESQTNEDRFAGSLASGLPSPIICNNNNNNTSLIIIDQDELNCNNESQVIQKIIDEYQRRLQEQVALARKDIVHELEQKIQTLLSETTTDDQHWSEELILLREKFTAKSQLEIAQLQMKHADEMSRLKQDYEKQLNRKNKRHSTFDSVRDFGKLLSERDSLRELSKAFRHVLSELLKCVAHCENDINENLSEEVQRLLTCNRTLEEHSFADLNQSNTLLNETLNTSKLRIVPDIQSLLEVVENPQLVQYVTESNSDVSDDFDLKDCLERLRSEASYLLHLSEEVVKKHNDKERRESFSSSHEKHDSEQEDGLKLQQQRKFIRVNSLNEQQLPTHQSSLIQQTQNLCSLPPDLNRFYLDSSSSIAQNASELNFQLVELKNCLIKSESDRLRLQQELEHTISRNSDLGQELQDLRDQLSQLGSLNTVEYNEGYGLGSLKSPQRLSNSENSSSSFALLQEKARNILSTPTQKQQCNDSTVQLLQMIEDFCREGDKVVECSKRDKEDLQSQIITADKQLKATRRFLEEQATEREQEHDEFIKEIENLKAQLRDKEKERSFYANASEEVEHLETQLRNLTQKLQESTAKRDKFEVELKASIDKIFVLREIISDLETQVETKALNEHVLGEKIKQLEEFINSQSRSNETLQSEVQSLKTEIEQSYQMRINQLEEKLQNIRPSAEQSIIMDQVVEQLRDIENTLEQKTKNLESLHSNGNSCSLSITEDVSAQGIGGAKTTQSLLTAIVTPPQGSPVHPSPRQHSLTMEGVQRVVEKLSKHSRVEEAAVKRIRDLEMQIQQMRTACVELQHERESLQERMSEQTQRISALQSRLEEQRQRAEELQRSNTSDLNIRIHDLQNELQTALETLTNRDKQIATMRQQLEKSKVAIDRLEAELAVEHQPDRSVIERLENELKQKQAENQKLKDRIKNEMINKLALPDLMETMLADKNEEIDHLKEQLENKQKELQSVLDDSQASSVEANCKKPEEASTKLSGRTLSDIISITEFDEPDVVRRAAAHTTNSPLLLPEGSSGFLQNTLDTSKGVVANLTHKRSEDLSGFPNPHQANTFDNLHYFQDPNILMNSAQSGASITPALVPRQINFSALTEDSKRRTPEISSSHKENSQQEVQQLKEKILELEKEKEKNADYLLSSQLRLTHLQDELVSSQKEVLSLQAEHKKFKGLQEELHEKALEIENLLREQEKLKKEKTELLSKNEKNLRNYQESEENLMKRLREMEEKILKNTEEEMKERENLRKELRTISENHDQCKYVQKDSEDRKRQIEILNQEIKTKDERLLTLTTKLSIADDHVLQLQTKISALEKDIEKLKQQNSDNSSKQFSVDEIAQQVEKELNYSAQLDSNILKAIESEEENNLDRSHQEKTVANEHPGTTDDENFTGERELLNQLEALRAQISAEREHAEDIRQELLLEKQHSQDVQEQDVIIIEAMRKRLESAMEQEDELHKQLDIERERCERLQSQLTTLQRTDSRRNSSLLKSPTESPRKSLRSLSDFESELTDRLRSEIKLLTAQNERERERSADLQRNTEREKLRYEKELSERIEYCEKLKKEMDKVARDKDNAEIEIEHLQERLTLQTQEIESLEARIASLQEAETRRFSRKEKQHKEYAQLMAEIQELKSQLLTLETEKEGLNKAITQLRFDVERSAHREAKLADALANANSNLAMREGQNNVPEQFLQKMKEINALLAENTQENKQMAETVQYLVEERRQLQKKCEELESQLSNSANVTELEERCNHLLGRYLRVESHRKALVYQKRYLKIFLQNYQDNEQIALAAYNGGQLLQIEHHKKKLFKTVALAVIAIQRMKYIGRIWHTGKRIVSKSVFTITQQKRSQAPIISCAAVTSTSPTHQANGQYQYPSHYQQQPPLNSPLKLLERPYAPLKTPTLLNGNRTPNSTSSSKSSPTAFEWPRVTVNNKMHKKT